MRLFLLIIGLLMALAGQPAGVTAAEAPNSAGCLVIFIADQISWPDLNQAQYPNLQQLIQQGAVGLLNTYTPGERRPDNTYLTLGASSPSLGFPYAGQAEESGGNLAVPDYPKLRDLNSSSNYKQDLGSLGQLLQEQGITVTVLGNADLSLDGTKLGRQAVSLLMNKRGLVERGKISAEILLEDPKSPGGFRTDETKLAQLFAEYYAPNQVLAVEFGDTSRAAFYGQAPSEALERADKLLGQIMAELDWQKDALIWLTPTPSPQQQKASNTFTPLIGWGANWEAGLLTSDSTRRAGIVSNLDLAPTILNYFNLPVSPLMYGEPWQRAVGDPAQLTELENDLVQNTLRRVPVLTALGIYVVLLLWLALSWKLGKRPRTERGNKIGRGLLLSVFWVPGAVLLLGLWPQLPGTASILAVLGLTGALTVLTYPLYQKSLELYLSAAGLGLVILVMLDLVNGSQLMLNSPLGYDLQRGARFYGLGNEYLGLLIGAAALGGSCLYQLQKTKLRKAGLLLGQVIVLVLCAWPAVGSNAGSSLAWTAVLISFLILWNEKKLSLKKVVIAALILALLIALLFGSDFWSDGHSHIGKALRDIQINGWWIALQIMGRKLLMNWHLMQTNLLTLLIPAAVVGLLVGLGRSTQSSAIIKGSQIALWGALIGFLANDSGIVVAALALIYPLFALLAEAWSKKSY